MVMILLVLLGYCVGYLEDSGSELDNVTIERLEVVVVVMVTLLLWML